MPGTRLLAFDCSTEFLSVAVSGEAGVLARHEQVGPANSQRILPLIDALLREAGVPRQALHAIAFGAGPGAFTGLRVACGVAQGLGFGLGKPLVPVLGLMALAEEADRDHVLAVLDARMGEVYVAAYQRVSGEWQTIVAPVLCAPDQLPGLPQANWTGVGNGFAAHDIGVGHPIDVLSHVATPRASAMLAIARRAFDRGDVCAADDAVPLYVRNKVALTSVEQRALR